MKIQTVCGFGCGSSLMLRMKLEEVLKKQNFEAEVFCGDVGTCLSTNATQFLFLKISIPALLIAPRCQSSPFGIS